jgi:GNAT superfamily N-acetyltransferase
MNGTMLDLSPTCQEDAEALAELRVLAMSLDHLYVRPEYPGRGIGSAVLGILFGEADSQGLEA